MKPVLGLCLLASAELLPQLLFKCWHCCAGRHHFNATCVPATVVCQQGTDFCSESFGCSSCYGHLPDPFPVLFGCSVFARNSATCCANSSGVMASHLSRVTQGWVAGSAVVGFAFCIVCTMNWRTITGFGQPTGTYPLVSLFCCKSLNHVETRSLSCVFTSSG